jgi:hypothetical protein
MPAPNEKYLSGVTGRFQLEAPDSMSATLKITTTLGTWREIKKSLDNAGDEYGMWQLKAMIRDLIDSGSASAYARIEDEAHSR